MSGRAVALGLVILLVACARVGGGGGETAETNRWTIPHQLRIGEYQDLSSLNPHLLASTSLSHLSQLTMAYLVRYDEHNRPVPELATEVPTQKNGLISRDGLTITWRLRHGVRWSDGEPFDADDVVFSTNAVNNPKNNEIGRDGWDLLTKVDEPDKYTVVFHLRKPYSAFLPTFFGSAGANPCILPKHVLGKLADINTTPYNAKPVGIGPYRYVSWKRGEAIELEPNPYYWRGQPKIAKISVRFITDMNTLQTQLQTGAIDLWSFPPSAKVAVLQALPGIKTIVQPGFFYGHLDFNTTRGPQHDVNVRRALRLATNRADILEKIGHGLGVLQEASITPVSPFAVTIPMVPFDLAAANALLEKSGWKRGPDGIRVKDGVKLSFVFATTAGTPDADRVIEQIRGTWSQVGASIDVHRYQPALFFGPYSSGGILMASKFDVVDFSWGQTPDGDLSVTNECSQVPPNGENVTRLCDAQLDVLLEQAKASYDEPARTAVIAKISARISELVPWFTLSIRDDVHAFNADLKGWHPNAVTPFDDFMSVDI